MSVDAGELVDRHQVVKMSCVTAQHHTDTWLVKELPSMLVTMMMIGCLAHGAMISDKDDQASSCNDPFWAEITCKLLQCTKPRFRGLDTRRSGRAVRLDGRQTNVFSAALRTNSNRLSTAPS